MKEFDTMNLIILGTVANCFVWFDGKLIEATPVKTSFNKVSGGDGIPKYEVTTLFKNGDEWFEVAGYDKIYDTIHDFEAGNPTDNLIGVCLTKNHKTVGKNAIVLSQMVLGYQYRGLLKYWVKDESNIGEDAFIEKELNVDCFSYDYEKNEWWCPAITEEHYPTRANALSWESYNIVDEDGTTKEVTGINKLISLEPDQQELVNQLADLLKKIQDNRIMLMTYLDDNIYAYNRRNVEDLSATYDPLREDGYEVADYRNEKFRVAKISEYSDDIEVWAKRKEAE